MAINEPDRKGECRAARNCLEDEAYRANKTASTAGSESSLVDPASVAKLLSKKDNAGKIKLKKSNPKPKAKDADSNGSIAEDTARSPSADSPLINEIDPELRATFPTGRPLEDKHDLVRCEHCKKPMIASVHSSHVKVCQKQKEDKLNKKKEAKEAARKARLAREKANSDKDGDIEMEDSVTVIKRGEDGDNDSVNGDSTTKPAKESAGKNTMEDGKKTNSKKRKADTEADKELKKKKTKKEEAASKPKIPKPKGPVDVEKQCGVALPNGAFCARSLTCKSHSMGAKRAVPGRSLPYDMLLAAYQKKNQAKQQKLPRFTMPIIFRKSARLKNKHRERERLLDVYTKQRAEKKLLLDVYTKKCAEKKLLLNQQLTEKLSRQTEAAIDANAPLADDFEPNGPIDSDEEKDAVMAAIARSKPQPVAQHMYIPIRKKYQHVRMKEMLQNALGGSRGGGLFATGDNGRGMYGGTNTGAADAGAGDGGPGDPGRRTSLAQQAQAQARNAAGVGSNHQGGSGAGGPSRKASMASVASVASQG